MRFTPFLLMILVACPEPSTQVPSDDSDGPEDTGAPPTPPTPPTLPPDETGDPEPCEPLVIWADPAGVAALNPTQLFASGGSGSVTWSLATNVSGGAINAFTGTYLAGEVVGVTDVIQADDEDCGLVETTEVEVLNVLAVDPPGGVVPFGASFDLVVTGGSATVDCVLGSTTAGSSLTSDCSYIAGSIEGYDLIQVTDALTNETVEVGFQVSADSGFDAGMGRIVLPMGASYVPTSVGGTGSVDLVVGGAELSVVDASIVGSAPGRTTVTLRDRFLGDEATIPVDVVSPLTMLEQRDGERTIQGMVKTGDFDGDGFTDAVVGTGEASVGAWWSGAAYVYRGSATGLEPAPVHVFSIPDEVAYYAADLTVADFNDDGLSDLVVGADFADAPGTDTGAVYLYAGVAGGFFEPEPSRVWAGEFVADHLGRSVTSCDFNGDGSMDLAVGAYAGEDRTPTPVPTNQGLVQIYLGGTFGLGASPDMTIYGKLPDSTGWRHEPNLQLGHRLESGDWNNDGKCDLFAGTTTYAADGEGNEGAVFIYAGADGGIEADPMRYIALQGEDPNAQFSFRMGTGDPDGDGRIDLAVGSWNEDTSLGLAGGKVRLFLAANHDGPAEILIDADDADLTVEGNAFDYLGLGVAFADIDADGVEELIADAAYASTPNAVRGGVLSAFEGTQVGVMPLEDGTTVAMGDVPYAFYGTAMAPTTNPPGFVVLASRDGTNGPEQGAIYWTDGNTNTMLEYPAEPSGGHLGVQGSMAWVDIDRDGTSELVGGAFEAAHQALGPSSGHVHVFPGLGAFPPLTFGGHADHAANDRFGAVVGHAGDFDGDGFDDAYVVSMRDSKPATLGAEFVNADACPGAVSAAGSVWIFRGSATGLELTPSFVYYSPIANDWIRTADAGFDYNGDGRDDVVVGSNIWDLNGGFGILQGRAADPSGITILCEADTVAYGGSASAQMGTAVAGIRDVDGDGCDEVLVGVDADDLGRSNQGSVRVFWGTGGVGCPTQQTVSTLVGGNAQDRAGGTLAVGEVDGDGISDLVVGMPLAGGGAGRVAVVRGSRLLALPRDPVNGPMVPPDAETNVEELVEPGWVRDGNAGSALGRGLAVLPGGLVAMGSPGTGGVEVFAVDANGLRDVPQIVVAGEAGQGQVGGGILGPREDGTWAVGAPRSDALVLDGGAIYPIPPP